jgi:uncharacterized protein (UPF0335 family)
MKKRRYAGGGDIQSKIDKLKELIDSPDTPETDKKNFREVLKNAEKKLAEEKKEDAKDEKKPVVKKPITTRKPIAKKPTTKSTTVKPKATTPKTAEKKVTKGIKMLSKKKVVIDGVEMSTDSKQFCDYLTAQFIKRQEQFKVKKTQRKKTKSVMAQVTDKIEKGVEKAIKTGASNQKPSLNKNPNVFIGKVEKLETATKNFLQQLKEVLGNDYDAKEVTDTANAIKKMISDLKKKYSKVK